jgi:flagellar M-ring protein FliF
MDFLNKSFAQLSDLLRSMTVGARITSGLLLAVVVISLTYLLYYRGSGPEVDLMNGVPVPPGQLDAMVAAFGKANLKDFEARGSQIRVPRGQQAKYMAALADAKVLPPNFGSYLREALNSNNYFESGKLKEEKLKVALQDELALIISKMSGIESAYVLYATDTKPGLSREKVVTASVSVKPVGTAPLDDDRVSSIRYLVAGAIAGLKPQNVNILDQNGRIHRGGGEGGGSAEDNLYLASTRNAEKHWREKVLNALAFIPNVTVEPTVILDRERFSRTKKTSLDPKPVTVNESEETTSRTHEGSAPAGRPGYQGQQPNVAASLNSRAAGSSEQQDDTKRKVVSLPSGEQVEKESVGFTPERVTVSVGIPSGYFEKVWQERNPPSEGQQSKGPDQAALTAIRLEEIARIRTHVAGMLPVAKGVTDPTELVTVTPFQEITPPKIPDPATSQRVKIGRAHV